MADIEILVDSSQVKTAKQELQDLGNSFNSAAKSASVYMQAFARAAAQSARDAKYLRDVARANQEIINKNLKVSNSYTSAEASAAAFTVELRKQEAQALKTARANQDTINKQLGVGGPSAVSGGAGYGAIEAEMLRLEATYNKVAVAARVYAQAEDSLNRAVMLGVLTADQKEAKLTEMSLAYKRVGDDSNKAAMFINRFGENAQVSGRGLNRFGMVAQQVGYQVGDFFVQIQSGTNFMVAFGQQATQLAGLIPGVLGAAIGIGISIFTAIGATIMRTNKSTKDFKETLSSFGDNLGSLNDVLGDTTLENYDKMLDKYGLLNQSVLDNIDNLKTLNAHLLSISQIDLGSLFSESFGGYLIGQIDEMRIAFDTTNDQARHLLGLMNSVGESVGPDQLIRSMTAFRDELVRTAGGVDNLTLQQANFVLEIDNAIKKAEEAKRSLDALSNSAPDGSWMNPAILGVDELVKAVEKALDRVASLRDAIRVTATVSTNGQVFPATAHATTGGFATVSIPPQTVDSEAGGGKTDPMVALRQQIKLENELLGLSEAQARVLQALGQDRGKYSKEEIALITAEIDAYNKKLEAIENSQKIWDTVKSSMEDAVMSMVEGTETVAGAFKQMAYEIIKELYNILVVQQMVGSFDTATGTGTGFAGLLGGLISGAHATGGSVMPNQAYLVGENGPELVVPRHSGTVVNANQTAAMGSSGSVTVNNNISVTGSDAAMVRTEIAKMIPQITNATKAAVIDAKQRGGQMAAAFR